MFPIATAGSFCKQIFLDPTKMKIYVQGSEVKPTKILRSLEEKETFDFDIFKHLEQDEIIDCAHEGRIAFSEEHGPSPPYNITVHVSLGTRHPTSVPRWSAMRKVCLIFGRVVLEILMQMYPNL